jgi:hypothetical protein
MTTEPIPLRYLTEATESIGLRDWRVGNSIVVRDGEALVEYDRYEEINFSWVDGPSAARVDEALEASGLGGPGWLVARDYSDVLAGALTFDAFCRGRMTLDHAIVEDLDDPLDKLPPESRRIGEVIVSLREQDEKLFGTVRRVTVPVIAALAEVDGYDDWQPPAPAPAPAPPMHWSTTLTHGSRRAPKPRPFMQPALATQQQMIREIQRMFTQNNGGF